MAARGKLVVDAGGVVVEVLASDVNGAPAKRSDLDAWVGAYSLPVTSVIDSPPGVALTTLTALERREYAFIVDLSTMIIVLRIDGSTAGVGASSASQAIDAILPMLAH